jgi:heat shock protein HslJ
MKRSTFCAALVPALGVLRGQTPVTQAALDALGKAELELALFREGGADKALPERKPTLAFGQAGRAAGFSGVNRFQARYQLSAGGVMQYDTGMPMTRMAGPPEAMAFETAFLKALGGKKTATLRDGVLRLQGEGGLMLEFRKK